MNVRSQDYGLIFHRGIRPMYFTECRVIKEKHGEYIEATLAIGGMITVHPYWSKRSNRMVAAIEAIYRQPNVNLQEMLLSTQAEDTDEDNQQA